MRKKETLKPIVMMVALNLFVLSGPLRGANNGTVTGGVKNASGQPAVGASVKAKHIDRGLTLMVFSQEQGRYRITNLPPGRYRVEALGGGFQSDLNPVVEVADGKTATADLTLGARQNLLDAMNSGHMGELLPDDNNKAVFESQCVACHGLEKYIDKRKPREEWKAVAEDMRRRGGMNQGMTDAERDAAVEYLAKHFGPDKPPLDPARNLPNSWITGPAAKSVVFEYQLPHNAGPHDVAADSKGIAWVCEREFGFLGRFDPNTFTYTRIPIPTPKASKFALNAIEVDEQDRVWVIDGGPNSQLVQYDPKTEAFTTYPIPKPPMGGPGFNAIRFHPDGTVWGTQITGNQILRIDPATKKVTEFTVPSGVKALSKKGAYPYGGAIDGSGMVWFVSSLTSKVGKVDPKTGEIAEFDVPDNRVILRRMATDAEGNVWAGQSGGIGRLLRIDYRTSKITPYTPPTRYSGPYSVGVDKKRSFIWFNEQFANQIARFDPRTESFVEYPVPTLRSDVRRIEVDRSRPNRVWFTGDSVDTVGYVDVVE